MLRFLYAMVRYGWSAAGLRQQISYMDAKIERLRRDVTARDELLAVAQRALESQRMAFDVEYGRTMSALDNSIASNRKLQEALDAVHEQYRTATEITIPNLVASHQVIISRYEASIAADAVKTALMRPEQGAM